MEQEQIAIEHAGRKCVASAYKHISTRLRRSDQSKPSTRLLLWDRTPASKVITYHNSVAPPPLRAFLLSSSGWTPSDQVQRAEVAVPFPAAAQLITP